MEHEMDRSGAAEEVTGEIAPVAGAEFWTDPNPTWQYETPQQGAAVGHAPGEAGVGQPIGEDVAQRGFATGSPIFGQAPATSYPQGGWYPPPPPPPPPGTAWGWTPPPGGPVPNAAQPDRAKSRRNVVRGGVTLFVVGVTMAAGIGVGHLVWRPASSSTSAQGSTSIGGGNTSPGSTTTPSSGGNGTTPGGSTGSTGQLPFGGNFPSFPNFPGGGGSSSSGGSNSTAPGSPTNVTSVASKVNPALVDINTVVDYGEGEAAGTGVVLTANGEVLTNNHVIDGATSISVTDVGNGTTYKATVVGYDRTDDIAVIQLTNASGLQTANIGDSSALQVGDGVIAIGNAGGAGGTPSAAGGSVTSLDQSITASDQGGGNQEQLHGLIEINANIQPGDSGGALVNSSGQVVGIDTAASSGLTFQSQTTDGYAIPINTAISIASQIVSGQSTSSIHLGESGFMGVKVYPNYSGSGAEVTGAISGSPAASAGLAAGDVITAINGQSIPSANTLTNVLTHYHPGDQITITWTDSSGHQHNGSLTLTTGPAA